MSSWGPDGYAHTQRGIWHWVLLLVAAISMTVVLSVAVATDSTVALLALPFSVLFALLAACFARLTVRDGGDALEIAFGPLELFRRRIPYSDISAANPDRSVLLEGWGIHYLPGRGGWVWNIHGFRCVRLTFFGGGRLRIGTDDPDGLVAFVRSRIAG